MQQNLLKAMLNNPEKTSTAWSKLPEPSNQSYLASKYIPRLIELSRYLLFIVVSSAKLFFENLKLAHLPGWYCRLSLEDCYSNLLFCSHYKLPPLFRSRYRVIVHCYYRFFSSYTSLRSFLAVTAQHAQYQPLTAQVNARRTSE